jgi:two-component system sensor histidine kinase CreC
VESIDVKTLIADVIKTPARLKRITDKSIALEYDIDRDFSLNVEKLLAEQAIGNVIDNAIDFTPNDSTITIQARELNKSINIKVMDQGEGIPEFARKQLFKRFFTTSRPDTGKRGNGLGLRFVREIMNLHGGDAQVKNRFMEKGAVATLSFPIKKG